MIANKCPAAWLAALAIPVLYLFLYTPYGMDTTDFGYFYGYAWRILNGQAPYRDFAYIKPALPLYWHAFWMWLTPHEWQVLGGKAGFLASILASSWMGALYLGRFFNLKNLGTPLPLLATAGFVFGVHSFPHMPWHTPDGVLFCAGSLLAAATGWPAVAGALGGCAMLCKQSFLLVPAAILAMLRFCRPNWRRECGWFILSLLLILCAFWFWIYSQGAWGNFRAMTTGQLDIREALDAGILIYLRQNWLIPILAVVPWFAYRMAKKSPPSFLSPCYDYLIILASWHIWQVYTQKNWIGFGYSWPTLFMLMGAGCVLFSHVFLNDYFKVSNLPHPGLAASLALFAALVASWSVAISGGYKIPAFFAAPLVFCFFLIHKRLGGNCTVLAWCTLCAGLVMFGAGYRYPYVFPVRPLVFSDYKYDAGDVYPAARGVMVDKDILERLQELKQLRAKYGPNYKTLPGFSMAYYLNGDQPVYGSDWLIDWEINGEVDKFYKELLDKNLVVFMERDQMDAKQADNYARAGYGVPRLVRKHWKIVEETPHFVVFRAPGNGAPH